jgi:hypothetical protein
MFRNIDKRENINTKTSIAAIIEQPALPACLRIDFAATAIVPIRFQTSGRQVDPRYPSVMAGTRHPMETVLRDLSSSAMACSVPQAAAPTDTAGLIHWPVLAWELIVTHRHCRLSPEQPTRLQHSHGA